MFQQTKNLFKTSFITRYSTFFAIILSVIFVGFALYRFLSLSRSELDEIPYTVASVNGENIYAEDFKNRLKVEKNIYLRYYNIADFNGTEGKILLGKIYSKVLEDIISEKLLLQEAKKYNIDVTQEELDREIDLIILQHGMSKSDLKEHLEHQGIDFDIYTKNLRNQIKMRKLEDMILKEANKDGDKIYYDEWLKNRIKESKIEIYYKILNTEEVVDECCKNH